MQITNVVCPENKYSIKCPDITEKDAKLWRDSKSKIFSWILTGVLALVAGALGLSNFFN